MARFDAAKAARIIPILFLTGCATAPPPVSVKVCPTIRVYSAAEQAQAASEMRALPVGSEIARFIVDYKQLRDEVRACTFVTK